jgi:hypothetical protein
MTPCCNTCRFWAEDGPYPDAKNQVTLRGECRRFPPVVAEIDSDRADAGLDLFPYTDTDDWCGGWREGIPPIGGWATTASSSDLRTSSLEDALAFLRFLMGEDEWKKEVTDKMQAKRPCDYDLSEHIGPHRCEGCRFWLRESTIPTGLCRRYPRSIGKLETDWCGEYRDFSPASSSAGG